MQGEKNSFDFQTGFEGFNKYDSQHAHQSLQGGLYSSEKYINEPSRENKNGSISQNQMIKSLNLSFEGLFSKIQALKEEHAFQPPKPKQTLNSDFNRFPKLNPQLKPKPINPFHKILNDNKVNGEQNKAKNGLMSVPNLHRKTEREIEQKSEIIKQQKPQVSLDSLIEKLSTENKVSTIFEQKKLTVQDLELGKCVGSGKFGDVFACRHKETGFLFALKKIFKSTILEYNMVTQFTRQLKIHYRLDHPNIIKLYTHFDDEYHIFLLMEYAEGGILMEKLKCTQQAASQYIDQTMDAVQYLHKLKIAHRDIKPENIVLQFNSVKLCDFGWSSFYDNEMKTTFCGTLDYLSPEMKDRGQYDNSVDIWSIGILAYELLIGTPPCKNELASWRKQGGGFGKQETQVKTKWQINYPPILTTLAEGFMRNILKENPQQRATLRFCSNHFFIRKYRQQLSQLQYYNDFQHIV